MSTCNHGSVNAQRNIVYHLIISSSSYDNQTLLLWQFTKTLKCPKIKTNNDFNFKLTTLFHWLFHLRPAGWSHGAGHTEVEGRNRSNWFCYHDNRCNQWQCIVSWIIYHIWYHHVTYLSISLLISASWTSSIHQITSCGTLWNVTSMSLCVCTSVVNHFILCDITIMFDLLLLFLLEYILSFECVQKLCPTNNTKVYTTHYYDSIVPLNIKKWLTCYIIDCVVTKSTKKNLVIFVSCEVNKFVQWGSSVTIS